MIIIIAIGVVVTFSLICYAACVAAGTADDREKELFNKWLEKNDCANSTDCMKTYPEMYKGD